MMEEATTQRLINGDARDLSFLADQSVHPAITSPPYWNLKKYNDSPSQLGHIDNYELFLGDLQKVWEHVFRVLVPGGRLVCVVGDVCVSRRQFGRHLVFPLHSDISVTCRKIGFDNLNPIIWHKIANASFEVENGSKCLQLVSKPQKSALLTARAGLLVVLKPVLGKPYEPNAITRNDIEFILMQRKPGGYRRPTDRQRQLSKIDKKDFAEWFSQIWTIPGASTKKHPAPFPMELATRLIRMFSFYADSVLDPFCGSGTSLIAALRNNRDGIGVEIDGEYCRMAAKSLNKECCDLFRTTNLVFEKATKSPRDTLELCVDPALYQARKHRRAMV